MDRFSEIMRTVLRWEGGYVNDPKDRGGPTKFGITHKTLAEWRGVAAVTADDVRRLTSDEAIEIYRDRYWKRIRGERLPAPIDFVVMDGAVNHGVSAMAGMLRQALGLPRSGGITAEVVEAIRAQGAGQDARLDLAVALAERRKRLYTRHPNATRFLRGWRNRLNGVMAAALQPYAASWSFDAGRTGGVDG